MLELIKSDYQNKKAEIPTHFETYYVSSEKIEGLKNLKLLQLPRLHLMKFKKGQIDKKELEEQYFRALDSRGQNLLGVDYGSCSVMVCGCETYKHSDTCPMPYLKKYMKIKNFEIEKYI